MNDPAGSDPVTAGRLRVVIVHHRGQGLLADCLSSLLQSSDGPTFDVVVVTNGCDEELPGVVYAERRIHVLECREPVGFAKANNAGVAWARERLGPESFLLFLNNDTRVEPDALPRLLAVMKENPELGALGPRLMVLGAESFVNSLGLNLSTIGEAWDEGIGRPLSEYEPLEHLRRVVAVTGSALCVRSSVFDTVGGWEELYGYYYEDLDLCLKIRSAGWEVAVVTDAVVHHSISATAPNPFKRFMSLRNRFLLLLRHWPLPLLARTVVKVVSAEAAIWLRRLLIGAREDARLQLRSWLSALRLAPRALGARLGTGKARGWSELLCQPGSVPEIILPHRVEAEG